MRKAFFLICFTVILLITGCNQPVLEEETISDNEQILGNATTEIAASAMSEVFKSNFLNVNYNTVRTTVAMPPSDASVDITNSDGTLTIKGKITKSYNLTSYTLDGTADLTLTFTNYKHGNYTINGQIRAIKTVSAVYELTADKFTVKSINITASVKGSISIVSPSFSKTCAIDLDISAAYSQGRWTTAGKGLVNKHKFSHSYTRTDSF